MPIFSFASRGGYYLEESLGTEPVILSYQYIMLEQTNNHKLARIITYYLPLSMLLKGYYRKVMLNYFLSFFSKPKLTQIFLSFQIIFYFNMVMKLNASGHSHTGVPLDLTEAMFQNVILLRFKKKCHTTASYF
jgi:hypothetical protein